MRIVSNTAFAAARNISRASVHAALQTTTPSAEVLFVTLDGWCTSSMSALAACYPHMQFNYVPNKWPALTEATRCLKRYENRSIMVTTGLMSIFHLLSTQTCPTMRLYGFDDESASPTSTYHYYDAGHLSDGRGALFDKYSKSRKGGHDFVAEHRLLRAMSTTPGTVRGPMVITHRTAMATCKLKLASNAASLVTRRGSCNYPICGERQEAGRAPNAPRTPALAWATMCVQHSVSNTATLDACLTSIGSLLLTSTRLQADVVALLDEMAMDALGGTLRHNGVITHAMPPVEDDVSLLRRDWTALQWRFRRNTTIPRQVLALYKMRVWLLADYHALVYFDVDVLFVRDPSSVMTHSASFAAIRLAGSKWGCKGKDYLNAGVMKLTPSRVAYDAMRATFLKGNFTDCGGSSATLDDQDVVRELAFNTNLLGTFHEWPLCFNYRGWPWQRHCSSPMLVHQERSAWPVHIRSRNGINVPASRIPSLMRNAQGTREALGYLRPSVRPYIVLERYWNASKADAAREEVVNLMKQCHSRGEGNDNRTMGAEAWAKHDHRFPLVKAFNEDNFLRKLADAHLHRPWPVPAYTLASSTGQGQSSGGGWHQDAPHRGIKAIMYLDDVDVDSGPFAMLLHYNAQLLRPNADKRRTRYDDDEIAGHAAVHGSTVRAVTAPRGSVVLFETSSVHRGMPRRRSGSRVAMTNYYDNRLPACRP